MIEVHKFYEIVDRIILRESKRFGNNSRGVKLAMTLYNIYPAAATKTWLSRNFNGNTNSVGKILDKYIEDGTVNRTRRIVRAQNNTSKVVPAVRLTKEGKKYIDTLFEEAFSTMREKDKDKLISHPDLSDIFM